MHPSKNIDFFRIKKSLMKKDNSINSITIKHLAKLMDTKYEQTTLNLYIRGKLFH
jgi:hypothetical protein